MPRGDRTGPRDVGRGLGYCAGYDTPGYKTPVYLQSQSNEKLTGQIEGSIQYPDWMENAFDKITGQYNPKNGEAVVVQDKSESQRVFLVAGFLVAGLILYNR